MRLKLFHCLCGRYAEFRTRRTQTGNLYYLYCSSCGSIEKLLNVCVDKTPATLREFPKEHGEQQARLMQDVARYQRRKEDKLYEED
jgi:hypothetical protein